MTYRRVADHQPTCIDEKRPLEAAKRRLQIAQEKVEAVRHWSRAIDRAVDEYRAAGAVGRLARRRSSQGAGRVGPDERGAGGLRGHGDSGDLAAARQARRVRPSAAGRPRQVDRPPAAGKEPTP